MLGKYAAKSLESTFSFALAYHGISVFDLTNLSERIAISGQKLESYVLLMNRICLDLSCSS